ncbi:MAG: hypothetical protein ACTS43_00650 [Candidatus Hodgkinia cicadicola]
MTAEGECTLGRMKLLTFDVNFIQTLRLNVTSGRNEMKLSSINIKG